MEERKVSFANLGIRALPVLGRVCVAVTHSHRGMPNKKGVTIQYASVFQFKNIHFFKTNQNVTAVLLKKLHENDSINQKVSVFSHGKQTDFLHYRFQFAILTSESTLSYNGSLSQPTLQHTQVMFPDAQSMKSTQNWNMEHFKPITPDRPSLPPLPCKNCHNVVPSLEDEDQELPHEKWRAKTGRIRSRIASTK
jgi:hypothetical protein